MQTKIFQPDSNNLTFQETSRCICLTIALSSLDPTLSCKTGQRIYIKIKKTVIETKPTLVIKFLFQKPYKKHFEFKSNTQVIFEYLNDLFDH